MDTLRQFSYTDGTPCHRELRRAYPTRCGLVLFLLVAVLPTATTGLAASISQEREASASGIAVFDAICADCHLGGDQGAPRIGDRAAWSKRSGKGMAALARYAQSGTCSTAPQDITANANALEIQRAVVHMVNHSGGNFTGPDAGGRPPGKRDRIEIVHSYCATCHALGVSGAPRVGDRQAWVKRLSKGIDRAVRSAVQGNHGMPPRGGADGLTDAEIAGAIAYMARSTEAEASGLRAKSRPAPTAETP